MSDAMPPDALPPEGFSQQDFSLAGGLPLIDDEALDHLQRLARLTVPEEDREALKRDLGKVLGFVAQLREVDVAGVSELTRPVKTTGATRPDVLAPSLARQQALALAPAQRDGFFEVPRTVDEG